MRYHEFNLHKQLTEYVKRTNQPTVYSYQDLYTFENTRIFEQQDSGKWQINYSNDYVRDVINKGERKGIRWPEAEPAIAEHPGLAYWYARDVIGGRFPEGEPAIASLLSFKKDYQKRFNVDLDKLTKNSIGKRIKRLFKK